jgi:hypothetical protein
VHRWEANQGWDNGTRGKNNAWDDVCYVWNVVCHKQNDGKSNDHENGNRIPEEGAAIPAPVESAMNAVEDVFYNCLLPRVWMLIG